jgi:hypothetical protein
MLGRIRVLGAALVVIILASSHPAWAAKASRVVLRDSTVYENVTFRVDNEYKVLELRRDDWKRTVSFTEVAAIVDESGVDVTEDYLEESFSPLSQPGADAVPAPSGTGEMAVTPLTSGQSPPVKRRFPWEVGFVVRPNYSVPIGDFYDGITSGVGFDADVIIPVSKQLALRGTVSRSGIREELDKYLDPGYDLIADDLSMNTWRYLFSVQYYDWPRWRRGGKTMYYVYSGLGAINHRFTGHMLVHDQAGDLDVVLYPTAGSLTRFMTTLGCGVTYKISPVLGIDLGGSLDVVYLGSDAESGSLFYSYYGDVQTALIFDFKAGICLFL